MCLQKMIGKKAVKIMADMKWTHEQQLAIEDVGGSLLINAAAGSGKTAVLVERAVRMIVREHEPIDAERLLILTFTNAAAQELRSRIDARLAQVVKDGGKTAALSRQRMGLKRAFIGTIDAFCIQLVREHFLQLDIPPDVMIVGEAQQNQLSADALAQTMEQMYADPSFADFAAMYGRARSDLAAEKAVLELYKHIRTLPWPDAQLQKYADMYSGKEGFLQSVWGRQMMEHATGAAERAGRLCATAIAEARSNAAIAAYEPVLLQDEQQIVELQRALGENRWDDAVRLVQSFAFAGLKAARGASDEDKQAVMFARDSVKEIVGELQRYCLVHTEEQWRQDCERARPMVQALCEAVQRYSDIFYEAKLAERVLDFSDVEQLALQLLSHPQTGRSKLAEQVSRHYDAVMVDEYQDTNELQAELYSCLARADGSNLFYVGDVKQSIYRFRQANPELFLRLKHSWAPHDGAAYPAVLNFGHNFRSNTAVIDGVNHIFKVLMSPQLGDVEYSEGERLIFGGHNLQEGSFELDVVQGGAEQEAAHIAKRIAQLIEQKAPVEHGGQTRPCRCDDFCILVRAKKHVPKFVQALAAQGIDAMADASDELLQTPEVLPVVAALAAIDNPGDDVNLAAAMLGPLFRFSADELAQLRAQWPKGRLWGAVAEAQDEKTQSFARQILFYRAMASEVGVGRLCEELVARTLYDAAVAAMPSGGARRENVYRFVGWAAEVEGSLKNGLSGFVRLCEGRAGARKQAAKSMHGHVSVLTIHKSKGLEFPFCFLADTGHAFNKRDLAERVQMHSELGVGFTLRTQHELYATLPLLAIRRRSANEMLSEEMRMLYVAATRARQHFIATVAVADIEKWVHKHAQQALLGGYTPFALAQASSMANWLGVAFLYHPDNKKIFNELGLPAPSIQGVQGSARIRVYQPQEVAPVRQMVYEMTADADEAMRQSIVKGFSAVPRRAVLAGVPAKVSVSALAKQQGAQPPRRRPSLMYAQGMSAAERGTAMHAFLQYADLAAARENIDKELQRLVQQGYMQAQGVKAVDKSGIAAFLASPLCERIDAASHRMREYDFIMAIPAVQLQKELPQELQQEEVLVQGIADLVLLYENEAEVVDYKTDRGVDEQELIQRYAEQLRLYRTAVEKQLGLPVKRVTIWSFGLAKEIQLPM